MDEIKNVFNLMRIQLQKIQEAMGKIRRNALNYSVKDYEEILLENLDTISDTKEKIPEIQGTGAKQGKEAGRREHQCAPSGRKGRGEP